jgi:hypothetical protein
MSDAAAIFPIPFMLCNIMFLAWYSGQLSMSLAIFSSIFII